jgi:hypothetical protein
MRPRQPHEERSYVRPSTFCGFTWARPSVLAYGRDFARTGSVNRSLFQGRAGWPEFSPPRLICGLILTERIQPMTGNWYVTPANDDSALENRPLLPRKEARGLTGQAERAR